MTFKLSEAGAKVLLAVDEAESAVVVDQGSAARLLAGGEYVACMPDTPLRLLAHGFLETDGYGRVKCTCRGQIAADMYRDGHHLYRDPGSSG